MDTFASYKFAEGPAHTKMSRSAFSRINSRRSRSILALGLHHAVTGERRSRIGRPLTYPLAQHVLMQIQIAGRLRSNTPRSLTSFAASSLNSRLNFRRCIRPLWFQKHLVSASTKPAAAQEEPMAQESEKLRFHEAHRAIGRQIEKDPHTCGGGRVPTRMRDAVRLMSRATLTRMWTPGTFTSGEPTPWGMGWPLRSRAIHPVATAIGGRRTAIFVYPDDRLAVIVLTNLAGGTPEDFAEELAGAVYPELKLVNGGGLSARALTLHRSLVASGFDHADAALAAVRRSDPAFIVPEDELNQWGGRLLEAEQPLEGRAVLALAVQMYPGSANAWDSLGEAEEMSNRPSAAIAAYHRSRSIDPTNDHATTQIAKLSSDPHASGTH